MLLALKTKTLSDRAMFVLLLHGRIQNGHLPAFFKGGRKNAIKGDISGTKNSQTKLHFPRYYACACGIPFDFRVTSIREFRLAISSIGIDLLS